MLSGFVRVLSVLCCYHQLLLVNGQMAYYHDSSESVNGTIPLELDFRLYYLKQVDELGLTMTLKGTLTLKCRDEEVWKFAQMVQPTRSKYAKSISIPNSMLWRPFVILYNSAEPTENIVDRNGHSNPIDINHQGIIQFWSTGFWQVTCNFSYEQFPFDTQRCGVYFMNFLSISYYKTIKWTFSIPKPDLLLSPHMVWEFEKSTHQMTNWTWDNNGVVDYSSVASFEIYLKRKWYPYYFYAITVPLICLTILQLATFALSKLDSNRSIYSISCLLSFAVMRSEIQTNIPKTAENIQVIILINLSIIGSTLVTLYSAISTYFFNNYKKFKIFKKSAFFLQSSFSHHHVDSIFFILFLIYYVILYGVIFTRLVHE